LTDQPTAEPTRHHTLTRRLAKVAGCTVVAYLAVAYILAPAFWVRYGRRHPSLEDIPTLTHTHSGIPGDPLNVSLIGTRDDLLRIMQAARWHAADRLSLRSDLVIAEASVLKRSDPAAPVSSLYLFGRKEDLAFEQEVGNSPRHRHHVRFWQTDKLDPDGRPVWIGSAVYDLRVGISRTTGQITHVTAPDVDVERDYLFQCLEQTSDLAEHSVVPDFQKTREGRNGGGDPWRTDGNLYVGVIKPLPAAAGP
jgi:hypothetical protein